MSPRRWMLAWVVLGLAVRLAFSLLYWTGRPLTHDEHEYLALGRSVSHGDGFVYPADEPASGTAQQIGRAPGYPVFLAGLHAGTPADSAPRRVKIAQSVVGTVGVWLIGLIAARAGGARAGIVATALAAVYPPLVWMPAYVFTETLYSTLALASAYVLDPLLAADAGPGGPSRSRGWGRPIAAGVLLGVASLTRPAMLFFLLFCAVWLLARGVARRGDRRSPRWGPLAVVLLVALLCIAPWTVRNARVYGRFVLIASEGGVTFWTGNHPLARGEGDLAANPDIKRAEVAFRQAHPGLSAEQLEPRYYRAALDWIRANPGAWAALLARKAFYTVVPIGPSYTLHSATYFAASAASYLLVLPAALIGGWRLRRSPAPPVALWSMAASTVVVGLIFFPQERFRIPVIDPALIVSAAALAGLTAHERTGRRSNL